MERTVSPGRLAHRQVEVRRAHTLTHGWLTLVPVSLRVHKVAHAQQRSITTHLSEVTS